MLENTFQQGDSFIHYSDPRIKILSGFITAFAIALLKTVEVSLGAFFISVSFILISSLPLKKVAKTLFLANIFIGFLWLFVPFSAAGDIVFYVWNWGVTYEGIRLALLITLKCNAILMIIITFIATIPIPVMGYALGSLGLSGKLVLILLMSYRYVHVISEEYNRLIQALKIRCFKPRTNFHTYKTYAYLIAMLFIRSYERGIRVYQAMVLRGFNGKFQTLKKFHIRKEDIILFCIMSLFSVLLLLFDGGSVAWHLF